MKDGQTDLGLVIFSRKMVGLPTDGGLKGGACIE